jgi:hypothetical protein
VAVCHAAVRFNPLPPRPVGGSKDNDKDEALAKCHAQTPRQELSRHLQIRAPPSSPSSSPRHYGWLVEDEGAKERPRLRGERPELYSSMRWLPPSTAAPTGGARGHRGRPPAPPAGYSSKKGTGEPQPLSHDSQSSWGGGGADSRSLGEDDTDIFTDVLSSVLEQLVRMGDVQRMPDGYLESVYHRALDLNEHFVH